MTMLRTITRTDDRRTTRVRTAPRGATKITTTGQVPQQPGGRFDFLSREVEQAIENREGNNPFEWPLELQYWIWNRSEAHRFALLADFMRDDAFIGVIDGHGRHKFGIVLCGVAHTGRAYLRNAAESGLCATVASAVKARKAYVHATDSMRGKFPGLDFRSRARDEYGNGVAERYYLWLCANAFAPDQAPIARLTPSGATRPSGRAQRIPLWMVDRIREVDSWNRSVLQKGTWS